MIIIAADANTLISALLGGVARDILFNTTYNFITTNHTINEVIKYLPYISKKSKVSIEEIEEALRILPIRIYNKEFYSDKVKKAKQLIAHIDKKDVDILALTLEISNILWTEDKHFEGIKEITLLKTKDFF